MKYGSFGFDDTGSLDVYVVKTGQYILCTEGVGGAYGGDDFLCECTTVGNVLARKSTGRMRRGSEKRRKEYELRGLR